ncbi:ATP-binding cassette domain-containing protein [Streptomyces sp. t39]|uniref:ATP-binding cassette domain-containing protein n=1 Tax=Streptomyces sp. t39 TaxID=1828156 RepID=UPI0011CDE1E5|nr:excinuclease ABC subunit UvrA [Streptomyces sp. t39]TXS49155.1 ATP-binding cassette domain-containing protein [Streptomyces sp. t39]
MHSPHDRFVRVRGAREHNLRGVDVDIPRDALVVFTGISGSGKSSLAFGTVYAEAQRRYFESVAPYARRLIHQVGAPAVGRISGLPPAVSLEQRRSAPTSRSSVGTVTTLSNSLRMLYSRAGDYPEGAPRLDSDAFSPNTAAGACPRCHGLGRVHATSEELLVPDPSLSIREGAIAAWPGAWQGKNLRDVLDALGYDVDRPWRELPAKDREWILFTDERPVVTVHPVREAGRIQRPYEGTYTSARRHVMHTFADSRSPALRARAERFLTSEPCPVCGGGRLRPEALAVTFAGRTIAEAAAMPLTELAALLRTAAGSAAPPDHAGGDAIAPGGDGGRDGAADAGAGAGDGGFPDGAGDGGFPDSAGDGGSPDSAGDGGSPDSAGDGGSPDSAGGDWSPDGAGAPGTGDGTTAGVLTADLLARVATVTELGLGYLSLDRPTPTLSSGELQRLRLATQLRSGLFGVVYVLDEPSAGLHPADTEALLVVLERLKAGGNSVFVVEHHLEVVRRADWLVDVGPLAGEHGGLVLYSGPPGGLAGVPASQTRRFLFGREPAASGEPREPSGTLLLGPVTRHNLHGLTTRLPLGVLTAVTGVSGSGKSTLVGAVDAGMPGVERLVTVDQKPIGRTPRSNLATYTGLFDVVRRLFAATDEARERGWKAGRFSFNTKGGRCETCQGEGFVSVELLFLPTTYAPCPDCGGARYNPATLEVRLRGLTIADVLGLTVEAAADFFAGDRSASRSLRALLDVGLGYLRLGQPATELSGGEAQRIKLATELQRERGSHTLYVLDEPTAGLHPADVEVLMRQLRGLVDAGHTVVVVEHDMDVVARADWVIDMGPGGGDEGGRVVAAGPPAEVARTTPGPTGPFLARALAR